MPCPLGPFRGLAVKVTAVYPTATYHRTRIKVLSLKEIECYLNLGTNIVKMNK